MNYSPDNLKSKRSLRLKGFTLVELLAVVAIMLLILKLTLPTLDGLLGKNGKGMARGQLIGDLNRARLLALQNGSPVYLVFMPLYEKALYSMPGVKVKPEWKESYFKTNLDANSLLGMQLTGYAIYSEGRPKMGLPPKWHSDWKRLPEGFSFDSTTLDLLPHSVPVKFLKPRGERAPQGFRLTLPAIKYNSRGVIEGGNLSGVYLSVSKGGVFPPLIEVGGRYLPENADWPELQMPDDRQWLHINGVTGRSGVMELTEDEVENGISITSKFPTSVSVFDIYITHSPILPSDLERELKAICPVLFPRTVYQPDWLDSTPDEWIPNGQHYPVPLGDDEKLNPIFTNINNVAEAIEIIRVLTGLSRYAEQGGIRAVYAPVKNY